jgi:hypothetical protein
MHQTTERIAALLAPFGEFVNPGIVEYEAVADQATEVFRAKGVVLIVALELAYQKGIISIFNGRAQCQEKRRWVSFRLDSPATRMM